MWTGLDLIPHAPTFLRGEQYHPEAVKELRKLGEGYEDCGGVVVISTHYYNQYAFPLNAGDPLPEMADWDSQYGMPHGTPRNWDGLPFLADSVQRATRVAGVPTKIEQVPIDHAVWAPLRWMFPHTPMPILPVGLSGLGPKTHIKMGRAIRKAVEDAPKPIAVLVSSNLTHRPDRLRWDSDELLPEGRIVDEAILRGLKEGDWTDYEQLDQRFLLEARPEGGDRLISLLKGLTQELRGELRYYGPAMGAYGMALVHFDPQQQKAA